MTNPRLAPPSLKDAPAGQLHTANGTSRLRLRRRFRPPQPSQVDGETRRSGSLYRVVWRWHFFAGLFVAPVLLTLAVTGGLYIFRDEIMNAVDADLVYVEPRETRVSYDQMVAAATAFDPTSVQIFGVDIEPHAERSVTVLMAGEDELFVRRYVDQHTGQVLGERNARDFFAIVLEIHRTLFVGTTGRIVIELVTCWTIVLLITGAYLWWPRGSGQGWWAGALVPRRTRKPYVLLRDLHAVSGIWLLPIIFVVACTGLIYTFVWGSGYAYAAQKTGAYAFVANPPKSTVTADGRLPLEQIVAVAREHCPAGSTLSVNFPATEDGCYLAYAGMTTGPTSRAAMAIDAYSGQVLAHRYLSNYPALSWWGSWNYSLHVGSILGMPTKIIWLLACVLLAAMPITGLAMWWQRRPSKQTGFPRRSDVRLPWWVVGLLSILSLLLPVLGASVLLLVAGEYGAGWLRRSPVKAT
jgi:uncharacterized iron-regulated membrane protein